MRAVNAPCHRSGTLGRRRCATARGADDASAMRYWASVSTPAQPGSSRDRSSKATFVAIPDATTRKNRPATTSAPAAEGAGVDTSSSFSSETRAKSDDISSSDLRISGSADIVAARARSSVDRFGRWPWWKEWRRVSAAVRGCSAIVLSESTRSRKSGEPITEDVRWRMRSGRSVAAIASNTRPLR